MRFYLYAVLALVILTILAPIATWCSSTISIYTDRQCYDRGDVVTLSISGVSGYVAIEVWNYEANYLLYVDQVNVSITKSIRIRVPLDAPEGIYTVLAAVNGSAPINATTFLVRNPTFRIVSVTPSRIEGSVGSETTVTVTVENLGSDGYAIVRVVNERGSVIASTRLFIGFREVKNANLRIALPYASGSYSWRIEVVDEKYGTVDDSRVIEVVVSPPPAAAAPPPPAITTPTPTTITMPLTTTVPPKKVAPQRFVYDLKSVAPAGRALSEIVVELPKGQLVIPRGTEMKVEGKPVTEIRVEVLTKPPKVIATEVPVGPIYNFEPSGAVFSKPVTIKLPFDPSKVPRGYKVFIAYFDPTLGVWTPVKTLYVDMVQGIAVGETTHFTVFSVVAFRIVYPVKTITVVQTLTKTQTTTSTVTRTQIVTEEVTKTRTSTVTALAIGTTTVTELKPVTRTVTETLTLKITKRTVAEYRTTLRLTTVMPTTMFATRTVTTVMRVTEIATPLATSVVVLLIGVVIAALLIRGRRQ